MNLVVYEVHPISTAVQDEYDRLSLRRKEAFIALASASAEQAAFIKRNRPAAAHYTTFDQIADGYYINFLSPFAFSENSLDANPGGLDVR